MRGATLLFYVAVAAISVGGASWVHFSWVNIGVIGVYAAAEMRGEGHHFFWVVMAIQLQVISSVVFMAYDDCSVFEEAYAKVGPTVYTLGNYGLHYAPSVVVYALSTRRHILCGRSRAVRQIILSFGIYLVWYFWEDPISTYGCDVPSVLGVLGAAAIDIVVMMVAVSE
jgi:hypothetical protein